MARLLYLESSPMGDTSATSALGRQFVAAYEQHHPHDEIDRIDLWTAELPRFDAAMIGAKFAVLRSQDASEQQRACWAEAVRWSARFNAADKFVFAVPMWNFGIPYVLKHFIDVVTLPGQNWSWSREQGYRALLPGKKAALIYTSAGDYPLAPHEDPSDFQKPYLRRWLRFLGVEQVHELNAAPTLTAVERLAALKADAARAAQALAERF